MTATPASSLVPPAGYRHLPLDRVGSTNSEAMRLALAGEPGDLWVTAGEQVQGRGRSGRAWASVAGNVYASLLLRLRCPPLLAPQLSLVAGVAVAEAVRALGGGGAAAAGAGAGAGLLRLKWPNDIMIGNAKLGGVLVESTSGGAGSGLVVVIGIGLNVAGVPEGLGRAATSLRAVGLLCGRDDVLAELFAAMARTLAIWDEGQGMAEVRTAWLDLAGPLGEPLVVNAGGGEVAGRFAGLDADGALLLDDTLGVRRRFTYGDVTLATSGSIFQDLTTNGR